MNQDEIREKYGFTQEDIQLLRRIRKKSEPTVKPRSKFLDKAVRLNINKRVRHAIVDRKVTEEGYVCLLDGKPLKNCSEQVQKAYLIQEMIDLRWTLNTDESLTPSGEEINDLSEFDDDGFEFSENFTPTISRDEFRVQRKIPKPIGENDEIVNPWT